MAEVISTATNRALREAVAKYGAKVSVGAFIEGVDGFAKVYLQNPPENFFTRISASEDSLVVKSKDNHEATRVSVAIDFKASHNDLACIVAPGFYNEKGEEDSVNGQLMRPVVRALTELEGRELAMDVYSIMSKLPDECLKA